jgi:23S rRNA (guanosine2251-2'-O)-methyltransferase
VEFHDANWLNEHAKDSGGVILFASAGSIPKLSSEIEISGMAVFLDGVEDPYNLGSAARSVYAAGADALLIRKRNWDFALPTILKASAGAFEKLAVYTVEDDESLVQFTQSQNLPLYAAWRGEQAISAFEAVWPKKCLIAIGGALRGLGAAVIENADTCVYIPYGRDFKNALDTPAAAAVLSFLWLQKQEQK